MNFIKNVFEFILWKCRNQKRFEHGIKQSFVQIHVLKHIKHPKTKIKTADNTKAPSLT